MKTYALYLQYTDMHQESGLEQLRLFCNDILKINMDKFVVIDNSLSEESNSQILESYDLIPGDNSLYEFSGWRKGWEYLREKVNVADDDVIIFANDTFHRNYGTDYLEKFSDVDWQNGDYMAGHMDAFPQEVIQNGETYSSWVRTNLFVVNGRTAQNLYPFQLPYDVQAVFSGDKKSFFSGNLLLSENLKLYLKTWLFGEKNEAGLPYIWHSADIHKSKSVSFFENKARAILTEHWLSVKARKSGASLIDIEKRKFKKKVKKGKKREVIVHAHIFKNAGTSLDAALEEWFGKKFLDFREDDKVRNQRGYLEDYISRNKRLRAIASHTTKLPLEDRKNIDYRLLFFLREPIKRATSVYNFEKMQDPVTPGAKNAKSMTIQEYFEWRLNKKSGGTIRNFQTRYLSGKLFTGEDLNESDFKKAVNMINKTETTGVVERYNSSIQLIENRLQAAFSGIRLTSIRKNVSTGERKYIRDVNHLKELLGISLYKNLVTQNYYDIKLYEYALEILEKRLEAYDLNKR